MDEAGPLGEAESAGRLAERAVYLLLVALAAGGVTGFSDSVRPGEARNHFVRLNLQNGVRLIQGGALSASLPWLVESLKIDSSNPQKEAIHRTRIASVLRQSPRPVGTWMLDGPIEQSRFSPDGSRILIAGRSEARVFEVKTGEPVTPTLRPVPARDSSDDTGCRAAGLSPDGSLVLTIFGFEARVWDAKTGQATTPPLEHERTVQWAAWSPDSRILATCSGRRVHVREARDGREIHPPLSHPDLVEHATFSPDGRRLLISFGGPDATLGVPGYGSSHRRVRSRSTGSTTRTTCSMALQPRRQSDRDLELRSNDQSLGFVYRQRGRNAVPSVVRLRELVQPRRAASRDRKCPRSADLERAILGG